MTSYGFYTPPQQAAVMKRELAHLDLISRVNAALPYSPRPVAQLNVPGIYQPGVTWQQWWAAAGGMITDSGMAHQAGLMFALGQASDPATATAAQVVDHILTSWASVNTGIGTGNDSPLVVCTSVPGMILADIGITGWKQRPAAHAQMFLEWLQTVVIPIVTRVINRPKPNNWNAWGLWLLMLCQRHLGLDLTSSIALLETYLETMIAPDGSLPAEMARVGSQLWYSYFCLVPLTCASRLVRNTTQGKSNPFTDTPAIPRALSFLNSMLQNPTAATGVAPGTMAQPWPYDLFAAMGEEYNSDDWRSVSDPHAPISYWGHHNGWNEPTLTEASGR